MIANGVWQNLLYKPKYETQQHKLEPIDISPGRQVIA